MLIKCDVKIEPYALTFVFLSINGSHFTGFFPKFYYIPRSYQMVILKFLYSLLREYFQLKGCNLCQLGISTEYIVE